MSEDSALEMTPEEADRQEASSWRYSNEVCMVLRLTSGRFAIFNSGREILAIVATLPELDPFLVAGKDEEPEPTPPTPTRLQSLLSDLKL